METLNAFELSADKDTLFVRSMYQKQRRFAQKKVVVYAGPYLLSDELEVVDEVTGYTGESCAQLLSLAGNSHWAVVGVAHTCL